MSQIDSKVHITSDRSRAFISCGCYAYDDNIRFNTDEYYFKDGDYGYMTITLGAHSSFWGRLKCFWKFLWKAEFWGDVLLSPKTVDELISWLQERREAQRLYQQEHREDYLDQ